MKKNVAYLPVPKSHVIPPTCPPASQRGEPCAALRHAVQRDFTFWRKSGIQLLRLLSFVFVLSFPQTISAQHTYRYEHPISAPVFLIASQDTFFNLNEDSLVAASLSPVDTTIREGKSTTIATFASMLVPGTGQLYNESYWKAPVVWGLGYYFYSVYKNQDDLYRKAGRNYEQYLAAVDTVSDTTKKLGLINIANGYRTFRDYYKNQRNEFGWYLVITYLLNVLDAYVDAALYNFEVSPNLQGTNQWRVRMKIPIR